MSSFKNDYKYHGKEDALAPTWEYKKKYRDFTPTIKPDSYFAGGNIIDK